MNRISLSRRGFIKNTGMITASGILLPNLLTGKALNSMNQSISISTDFVSGGGDVRVVSENPHRIRFKAHNEGGGGWSQVWWYFALEGVKSGEEIVLELDRGVPASAGISPQVFFSYDQKVWGLTDTGKSAIIDSREFFVYKHVVRGDKVWFAYDLPYTPAHLDLLLTSDVSKNPDAEIFEFCKTKKGRPVTAIRFDKPKQESKKKHGIWLQARTHAFESGSSWVLHELLRWLISEDPMAKNLLDCSTLVVVPIVDVDGVVEGRTGKNQQPHDHNRGWDILPDHWPETKASKSLLMEWKEQNMLDMFIDFHGPGNNSHPYFIIAETNSLPYDKQQKNRKKFFEVLKSKPLDDIARLSQSMTQIYHSERPWDQKPNTARKWVTMETTDHNVALTLEVNMNTPLSTMDGYRSEAITLGRAISNYFVQNHHQR